jgi:prepilin-type N-terminal cleavage/methylation domain-containing protein
MKKEKLYNGFTLIELMVVMALMAVLAVLVLGAVQLARNTATETIHRSNAKAVQTALEASFSKYKVYCNSTPDSDQLDCDEGDVKYSLSTAYSRLTGKSLDNPGAKDIGKCYSTGSTNIDAYGGGEVFDVQPNAYAIGVAKADCSNYTADGDTIRANDTTTLPSAL